MFWVARHSMAQHGARSVVRGWVVASTDTSSPPLNAAGKQSREGGRHLMLLVGRAHEGSGRRAESQRMLVLAQPNKLVNACVQH